MRIHESAENYLEAILVLKERNGFVRSIDIAHELSFTKPSVSVAMKAFRNEGYITVDDSGGISLTEKGKMIAERVYERHRIITKALLLLGVDEETAAHDSCKIEHDLSDVTFEKLKEFVNSRE